MIIGGSRSSLSAIIILRYHMRWLGSAHPSRQKYCHGLARSANEAHKLAHARTRTPRDVVVSFGSSASDSARPDVCHCGPVKVTVTVAECTTSTGCISGRGNSAPAAKNESSESARSLKPDVHFNAFLVPLEPLQPKILVSPGLGRTPRFKADTSAKAICAVAAPPFAISIVSESHPSKHPSSFSSFSMSSSCPPLPLSLPLLTQEQWPPASSSPKQQSAGARRLPSSCLLNWSSGCVNLCCQALAICCCQCSVRAFLCEAQRIACQLAFDLLRREKKYGI